MPINANARNYLDNQLQYVPDYQDPLKKYRARQERLEEELDRIGIEDPTERNRIRREYLGNEPINEGGFFSEQLPRSAARGGLGLVENIGSVGEYLGDVTDLDVVKEPFGALARTFRREKEELDPAYDSEDPGVSDYVNMAVESGLASAPAMVAPMGGARLGFLGARALLGAGGKEVSKRALMGSAIGGGFVGGSASNAGLEGGTTYSQVKEQMLQQGFSDREAEREARRQADYVATQNLGANPELLGYNVAQSFSGPAGKLLGGATGRANAMRRMGVGSALEGLQEGAQYEVQQQAAGNMDANRFLDQEGRTSMIVGAISDLPFSAIDVALPDPNYQKVDSRVDPEASALKRSQEAAYAQVEESDRLEAQRQEALRQEEERIRQQDEARKRQLQLERERLKLMSEQARYRKETDPINFTMRDPAIEMGDGTTPQAEELRQIADDKLPGEREAESLRIPKSGLWQDGEEITDPTFGFGRQKQPGEDVDFTMKEGGFDSRLPKAPERPAPEPDPQPEFTMRDSAIEMPAGPMDQPVEPTAPTPRQIEQQQDYNYPVPPAPMEQEAVAPETPVLPAINKEGKTNNGRVTDDTAGAIPKNIFDPPEAPTLVNRRDQPDLEPDAPFDENARPSGGTEEEIITNPQRVREKFEEIGYQDQKPVLDDGIDGLIQSRYSQALPNVFVFEGLTSWSAGHFNGGVGISGRSEFDSDKSRIGYLLAHEFGHASHSLLGDKINANSAVRNELKAIEEFLYPGLRQRVQEADTEGRNIDKQFFNYLLSAEELIAEINPYRLANPEQVQQIAPALSKLLASVEQAPNLVVPRKVFPRGIFSSKAQAIGKLDENLKLKADRQASVGQIYDQDNAAFEIARLLKGNLNKDYGYISEDIPFEALQSGESQIDLTSPKGKIELATIYSAHGYSRDRQKLERAAQLMDEAFQTDPTKAERASNKSLKKRIDERLAELNQTDPVIEETAPLPESLPEETLEPTPADELKSDLLRKKDAATQAYEAMDESLFGTKEEDKLDAAMEKADRAYERGLTKAQKEWDKLSANTGKKGTLAPNQLQNAERRTKKLFEDVGLRRSQADPLVYTQKLIEFGKDEMANTTPGEADVVQGRKREEMEDDFGMDDSSGGGVYSGYGDSNQYYDDTDTDLTSELRYSYSATSRPTNAAGPSTKLTARQVNAAMEGVKSVLKKLDPNGDKVTVVANKDEAVAKLREMNRNRLADQLANDEGNEGFTITSTGEIFLIADQIEGGNLREAVDRMVEVTFHEALGHAGLRGLMGDNFGKFVKNFGVKNGKKIDAWLKTSEGKPYSTKDRDTQIEEYIARNFAEKGVQDVQFLENLVQNVMSFFGLRKYSETALKQAMLKVQDAYLDRGGDIINGAQQTEQENTEQEGEEQTEESAPQPEKPRPTRTVQYKPPRGLEKSTKYMDFADQAYALFGRYNSPEDVQKAIAEFVVRKKDKESLLTYENLDQIGEILRKNREFKERAEGGIQAEIRASRKPNDLKQERIQLIEKLRQGEITNEQYDQWIDENDPIMTLGEKYGIEGGVPTPATDAEIEAHTGGIKNAGKAIGKVLDKDVTIPDGTLVGNRLDIPAYTDFDSWIVTLHDGTSKGGNALAYGAAARIKGHPNLNGKVEFTTAPKQAFQIAGGRSKSTIARMRGGYVNQDRNSLTQEAQDIIKNKTPGWVEVGMNPNRASYFYDKANRRPLLAADEVIQVGALVLAKNPTYGTKDDFSFVDKETGNTIRFSSRPTSNLIGGQVPLSNWTTPTESKIDDFLYTMQDKMIDTKRVVESIKEAVGNIDERWNPYLQEELYHGRTAKETKDFLTNELQPLMEDLQRFGVSIKDFDNYLWNRHAEERNIQMAKVNPDMPDGGSGRTTAEARDYLANLSPQKRRVFEQLAQRVDNITSQTRQILKDSSLESAETVDTWESTYEKYVPLEREEFDFQPMQPGAGIGQGYDVRNPASRRAVGSERGVVDVLANVALQRERAITRSNKNKVAQAVYGLAAQNPNTDFWLVIDPAGQKDVRQLAQTLQNMGLPADIAENFAKEPVTISTDTRTGLKVSRINASIRNSDNYLSTRINGQDKFVIFNAKNPSSQRMVRSLKNLDADQLGRVMGILGNVTRWMTSVNTQYNPIFGVVNLIRDVQGALINLTSTPIGNKQRQVFAGTPLALKGIYAVLRKDTNRQNQYSQLWEEFQQEGGQTGYKDMFARSDERATALEKELKGLSAGKPMKTLNSIRDWLSDYNEAMENAVRLSAYKVAKEEGMSKQAAASLAKNLTVNFNRKGQIATQAGALYSFFNAAVQGTGRMYETMRGPAGAKILKGGLLLGTAQALLLEAADFDEDEPPYFVREKNIILPLVGGGYLTIPMPLGLHIIPNTSRILTEFVLSGGRDTAKRVGQFTGSFLDAFNPIGNAGWSVQTIAPTVADPLVALSENRDWTGSPIAKEDMVSTRPTPGYTRAKDTASTLNTYLAYFLNAASGGTDYQKGLFSPTPDQLDYLVGQAFGGVGRELLKAEQTLSSAVTGEELPPYKIPLAGRFYGNTESSAATSNRFYTNITRLNEHEAEVKGRRANRENVAEYLREFPEARLAGFAGQVETAVRKLQKRKREMLKKNASRSSIEAIEKLITRRMQTLNDRVERFAQTAD